MKIVRISILRDGGSIIIEAELNKIYLIDQRIKSKTKGKLYVDHFINCDDNIITHQLPVALDLIHALNEFEPPDTDAQIVVSQALVYLSDIVHNK